MYKLFDIAVYKSKIGSFTMLSIATLSKKVNQYLFLERFLEDMRNSLLTPRTFLADRRHTLTQLCNNDGEDLFMHQKLFAISDR